jgi:hypothetical protein
MPPALLGTHAAPIIKSHAPDATPMAPMHALRAVAFFLLFAIVVDALSEEEMDSEALRDLCFDHWQQMMHVHRGMEPCNSRIECWTRSNFDTAIIIGNFVLSLIARGAAYAAVGAIIASPIVCVLGGVSFAMKRLRKRRQARTPSE